MLKPEILAVPTCFVEKHLINKTFLSETINLFNYLSTVQITNNQTAKRMVLQI